MLSPPLLESLPYSPALFTTVDRWGHEFIEFEFRPDGRVRRREALHLFITHYMHA
jgi:hypothetical protein